MKVNLFTNIESILKKLNYSAVNVSITTLSPLAIDFQKSNFYPKPKQ